MLTYTIFLRSVSIRRHPRWLYLSRDWSCLSCDMRGSGFPPICQWWRGKTRSLLKRWRGAKLIFVVLEKKRKEKVRTLLMRVVTLMKILITSPLILKTWKPHLHSLKGSHMHSLKDSYMHLLMLPIASTCFLIDSTISNVHRRLCNGHWMIIVRTPLLRWCIFMSKSLLSPLQLETWRARTSTFGHFGKKGGVVVSWGGVQLEGE